MPIFHNTRAFIPIILLPWIYLIIKDKNKRWQLALLIPLVIIMADQTGLLIKKTVLRPRPWAGLDPDMVNLLVDQKGRNLSFPSNHAANVSGLATIFSFIYHRYKYLFWTLAVTVIFSRVYIGVHYPLDVATGCIIGSACGLILVKCWNYFRPNFNNTQINHK